MYVLDFDEYESNPTFDDCVFAKPNMDCYNATSSSSKWNSLIARFASADLSVEERHRQLIADFKGHYKLKANKFIGESFEEFMKLHTGFVPSQARASEGYKNNVPFEHPELDDAGKWYINQTTGIKTLFPTQLDWRVSGGVTPVRE